MQYKVETHMHTSEVSRCGKAAAIEMVRAYKAGGYSTLIITDHFFNGNCLVDNSLPWQDKVTQFMLGYNAARAEGERLGMYVLFSFEYGHHGEDFLSFGLGEQFLREHPDVDKMPLADYLLLAHECGGMIAQAHPFRQAAYLPPHTQQYPELCEAIEVYNGAPNHDPYNKQALDMAIQYGKLQTSGSDAHCISDCCVAGMIFNEPVPDFDAFMRLTRAGGYELIRNRKQAITLI